MSNAIQGTPHIDWGSVQLDVAKPAGAPSEFMQTVRHAIDQVQELQGEAEAQVMQMLHGNGQDVHSAMIAVEKSRSVVSIDDAGKEQNCAGISRNCSHVVLTHKPWL